MKVKGSYMKEATGIILHATTLEVAVVKYLYCLEAQFDFVYFVTLGINTHRSVLAASVLILVLPIAYGSVSHFLLFIQCNILTSVIHWT
jgi:hypothetical protein